MSLELDRRLSALGAAADLADNRLDAAVVVDAHAVVARAGARLGFGVEHTVVALAGPTGAGKSLLFNVLAGADLARVGRRRPTTATAQALAFGNGADTLLDWLEIQLRHRRDGGGLAGLVLLDLPDFDSVETTHRLEVDRLVQLADLLVWIVEPQKYADASLHRGYLQPLRQHAGAMAMVLNQADLLDAADAESWRRDAVRLLAEDGLGEMPVLVVSASTGLGIDGLRELVAGRVERRRAAITRLSADVETSARALAESCGSGTAVGVRDDERSRLVAAFEDAAGVPHLVQAVDRAHRRRGALATGWPFVRWITRLRPDPLKRLRVPETSQPTVRTSRPSPSPVQEAQVLTATRQFADRATEGLPSPWPRLGREAAAARSAEVADRLDRAVAGANLQMTRPRWWRAAGALQLVLACAVAAGAVWLGLLAVSGYLRIEEVVPLPEIAGIPVPTWLVLGGALVGVLLALVTRVVNGVGARRRARRAARALGAGVEEVADELVVAPLEAELAAHEQLQTEIDVAAGRA